MPRRTLPAQANKDTRPEHPRRRRIETNGRTTAYIEDYPGFSAQLVGATDRQTFRGTDTEWQSLKHHRGKQPTEPG